MNIVRFSFLDADKIRTNEDPQEWCVRCLPLSEIKSFTLKRPLEDDELKIIYNEGFILNNIEDNYYTFIKKD